LVSAVVAIAMVAGVARAGDDLAEARRLEAALDYAGAIAVVNRLLVRGGADPGQLAELHLLAGRLAAGLDRPQVAEGHFARLLALRPEARLPDGTSPKLTAPFETARARSIPLRLHVTSARGLITIHRDADALGLVVGIQVHVVDAAGTHSDVTDRARVRIAIPATTSAIEVAALDAAGNRVWIGTAPDEPIVDAPRPPRVVFGEGPPFVARWPLWAAITGVAIGTGAVATWKFRAAQDDWDRLQRSGNAEFSVLEDLERRGRRWGWTANIAFGAAVVTGLVSLSFYVRGNHGPIALQVGPGPGAGLAVGGQF
jgi:hypothetical protein